MLNIIEGSRTSSLLIKWNNVVDGTRIMRVLMLPMGNYMILGFVVRRPWLKFWFYNFPVEWPLMFLNLTTFAYWPIKMIY